MMPLSATERIDRARVRGRVTITDIENDILGVLRRRSIEVPTGTHYERELKKRLGLTHHQGKLTEALKRLEATNKVKIVDAGVTTEYGSRNSAVRSGGKIAYNVTSDPREHPVVRISIA